MSDDKDPLTGQESASAERVETEVIRRLRRRAWIAVLVLAVLSYFGIKEIVRSATETEIREASKAAILAEEKAKRAAAATDEATKITEGYSKSVGALQDEAVGVRAQFVALRQRLDGESASLKARADRTRSDTDVRLSRLEELVAKVAQDAQTSRQAVEAYRRDIEKIKAAAEADAKRFVANGEYWVTIRFRPPTKELAERARDILAKQGFKVGLLDVDQDDWTGLRIAGQTTTNAPMLPGANTIRFAEGASVKAQEVRDLLAQLVAIKTVEQLPPIVGRIQITAEWLTKPSTRIVVYLVEKP